jgi:hypothetical protein
MSRASLGVAMHSTVSGIAPSAMFTCVFYSARM